eukprot:NODE_30_length_3364_cov_7.901761_g28_i0.p1 GENE.NODE_30_length_3364_cov_7.901761_g28_i0~~NODE_30_length_3364_cov_7.901761_g28_i0.p1  ORF type:complete len:1086 (+),score=258.00 NODE_30_length_3364_cov_7.901761_g28_i0:404-3259(+)
MEFFAGTVRASSGSPTWVNIYDSPEEQGMADHQLTNTDEAWSWWKSGEPNNAGHMGERLLLANYHYRAYWYRMDLHGLWNDIRGASRARYALFEFTTPPPSGGCRTPYNSEKHKHDRVCNWRSNERQCSLNQCLLPGTPGGAHADPPLEGEPDVRKKVQPYGTRCDHRDQRRVGDHCDHDGKCVGDLPEWSCRAFGDPHFRKYSTFEDKWPRPIYHTMWAPDDRFYAPQPDTLDGELLFSESVNPGTLDFQLYLRFFRLPNTYASGNKYVRIFFPASATRPNPYNLVVDKDNYGWALYDASGPDPNGQMINSAGQYPRTPFNPPYFGALETGHAVVNGGEYDLSTFGLGAATVAFRGFPRPADLFGDRPTKIRDTQIHIDLSDDVHIIISRWLILESWLLNVNLYTENGVPHEGGPQPSVSTGGYCLLPSPPTADMCALLEGHTPEKYATKMETINLATECCEGLHPTAAEACESDFCILYKPGEDDAFSKACRKDEYDDPCEPCEGAECDPPSDVCVVDAENCDDCDCDNAPACGVGNENALECDCNDNDPAVAPARLEVCGDGKDNDCDGNIDDVNEAEFPNSENPPACDAVPVAQCVDTIVMAYVPDTTPPVPCVDDGSYDAEGALAYSYDMYHQCTDCETSEDGVIEVDGTKYRWVAEWGQDAFAIKNQELTKSLVRLTVTDNVGQSSSCDTVIEVSEENNPTIVVPGPPIQRLFGETMQIAGWSVQDGDLPRVESGADRQMSATVTITYLDSATFTGPVAPTPHTVQVYAPLVQIQANGGVPTNIAQGTACPADRACDVFTLTVTNPTEVTDFVNSIRFTSQSIKSHFVLDFSITVSAEDLGGTDGPTEGSTREYRFKPLCTQQFLSGCKVPENFAELPPFRVEQGCTNNACAMGWENAANDGGEVFCRPSRSVWGDLVDPWVGSGAPDYSLLPCGVPQGQECLAA